MSRWRGDKRVNKRRLSLSEALADAYLINVLGADSTLICELPKGPKDLPLPRLLGRQGEEKVFAVIPGIFVKTLLQKKRGFSEASQYLEGLSMGLLESASSLHILIWDGENVLSADRVELLRKRIDSPITWVNSDKIQEVYRDLEASIESGMNCHDNWFLESWRWIKARGKETSEGPKPTSEND